MQKKNEELKKILIIWNNAQNAVDTFETIDMAITYFDEKKVLKSGNAAIEYLAKYRRAKRIIFDQDNRFYDSSKDYFLGGDREVLG